MPRQALRTPTAPASNPRRSWTTSTWTTFSTPYTKVAAITRTVIATRPSVERMALAPSMIWWAMLGAASPARSPCAAPDVADPADEQRRPRERRAVDDEGWCRPCQRHQGGSDCGSDEPRQLSDRRLRRVGRGEITLGDEQRGRRHGRRPVRRREHRRDDHESDDGEGVDADGDDERQDDHRRHAPGQQDLQDDGVTVGDRPADRASNTNVAMRAVAAAATQPGEPVSSIRYTTSATTRRNHRPRRSRCRR